MTDVKILIDTNADKVTQDFNRLGNTVLAQVKKAQALERGYKALDRAFNKGQISAQKYARGIAQIDKSIEMALVGQSQLAAATNRTAKAMNMMSTAQAVSTRRMGRGSVITQQAGYQIGDFLVQVQSGTNAFVAFGQQATQVAGTLTILGGKWVLIGTILGVVIPLTTALGAAIARTSTDISFMSDQLDVISPILDSISSALSSVKNSFIDFANLLVNNMDRIITYGLTLAGLMVGKFAAGFIAARVAAMSLVGALTLLRGALLRTGIGIVIVAAGELVYQFTRLAKAAGGFGEAVGLMKDVAVESVSNIVKLFPSIPTAMRVAATNMNIWFTTKLAEMTYQFEQFTWTVAEGLNEVMGTSLTGIKGSGPTGIMPSRAMFIGILELEKTRDALQAQLDNMLGDAGTSTEAIDALRTAMKSLDDVSRDIDLRSVFSGLGAGAEEGGSGGAGLADTVSEATTKVQELADTMAQSLGNGFTAMVEGTKSVKDAFREMARDIVKQLWDVFVMQKIIGSASGGTGIAGAIAGIFQADGGAWNQGVQMYADGGVVGSPTMFGHSGGLGVMGEAGPEAIMPLKRGKNGKLGVQMEGSGESIVIKQSFNFSANGDDSVKRIIATEAPKIAALTQKQILDQRRRGGIMKSTFG